MEFSDAVCSAGIYSASFILGKNNFFFIKVRKIFYFFHEKSFYLGMEMVGARRRVFGSTVMCCIFAFGEVVLGFGAMSVQHWRYLLRIFYIPALLAIFLPLLIPESVR